jgi:predicted nucleic acid-binding protein
MILVDTSVWMQHLRAGNDKLRSLLYDEQVFCHPFVIGELACGALHNRTYILSLLRALPQARLIAHEEVLNTIESRRLSGRGLGWIDAHLIASALLTNCRLWTLDKSLQRIADGFNLRQSRKRVVS